MTRTKEPNRELCKCLTPMPSLLHAPLLPGAQHPAVRSVSVTFSVKRPVKRRQSTDSSNSGPVPTFYKQDPICQTEILQQIQDTLDRNTFLDLFLDVIMSGHHWLDNCHCIKFTCSYSDKSNNTIYNDEHLHLKKTKKTLTLYVKIWRVPLFRRL